MNAVELVSIAAIRWRYFRTSFWRSVVQVVIGGAAVFAVGVYVGGA